MGTTEAVPTRTNATKATGPFSAKQAALIALPPALLGSTYLVYGWLVDLLGQKPGYFGGFLFYWLFWCLLVPLWAIGPQGLRDIFRDVRPRLGRPTWLGGVLIAFPVVMAYATKFPEVVPHANLLIVIASAAIALVNATAEEVLWRGTYVKAFPGRPALGYLYPALGFGLWHLAPQSIFPNQLPGGTAALVAFAVVLGLMWGWVAWRTGSIRWTTVSHFLLDFAGLGALLYFG